MTNDTILDAVIAREGGYVNNPADAGGPTNFGITLATLAAYRGRPATADDVRALTEAEAREIYRVRYIDGPGYGAIADDDLRALVVDCAVNHGSGRATRWLQAAAGVSPDGILGPATRAAVGVSNARELRARVTAARARAYGHLITRDPAQSVFAAGWLDRLAEFIEGLS